MQSKRNIAFACAFFLALVFSQNPAQATTTYTYTGFDLQSDPGTIDPTFFDGFALQFSFTVASSLIANRPLSNVGELIESYSFVLSSGAGPLTIFDAPFTSISVGTDNFGQINEWIISEDNQIAKPTTVSSIFRLGSDGFDNFSSSTSVASGDAVPVVHPTLRPIARVERPSAASNTIRARRRIRCSLFLDRTNLSSSVRSDTVNSIGVAVGMIFVIPY